ncbi:MAG: adenylyl-sulfate kinase [Thermoplasmata archaeon]
MSASAEMHRSGFVVWMEGIPGAGKSTLSRATAARLQSAGWDTEVLDGEQVRRMFSPELGFSRSDREMHSRRVSHVAQLLARHGIAVLVAMITPYETSRQAARSEVGARFVEIWLQCPLEICRQRDPQAIYRRTDLGDVPRMTGVDDPFEQPMSADLVVDTSTKSVPVCVDQIVEFLKTRHLT